MRRMRVLRALLSRAESVCHSGNADGALRMSVSEGSYIAQAKSQDLNLSIGPKSGYGPQPEGKDRDKGFAPGFEDDESGSD